MEYLPGGDLYSLLQGVGSFDETTARIYTLEILQALLYLRQNGIVHRDLKPDNLLISSSGYIRLADFGLSHLGLIDRQNSANTDPQPKNIPIQDPIDSMLASQSSNNKKYDLSSPHPRKPQIATSSRTEIDINSKNNIITFYDHSPSSFALSDEDGSSVCANDVVGTPDYIAPEILMNNPHGFTADYWSLGCILFEFLVGIPPFHASTENETFKNILTGKMHPFEDQAEEDENNDEEDVIEISNEAKDLILKLLEPDPSKRLGVNGVEEIRDHPWFDEFRGQDVDKIEPPFKPQLKGIDDTGYFKQRYSFKDRDDEDIIEDIANESDQKKTDLDENGEADNKNKKSKRSQKSNKSVDLSTAKASSLLRHNSSDNFTSILENYSDYDSENDDDNSSDSTDDQKDVNSDNDKDPMWQSFRKSKKRKDENDSSHSGSFSFKKKKYDVKPKNSSLIRKKKSKRELMSEFQSVGIDQIMKKNEELSKTRSKKENKDGTFVKSSSTTDLNLIDQQKENKEIEQPPFTNSLPQSPLLDSFNSEITDSSPLSKSEIQNETELIEQNPSIEVSSSEKEKSQSSSSQFESASKHHSHKKSKNDHESPSLPSSSSPLISESEINPLSPTAPSPHKKKTLFSLSHEGHKKHSKSEKESKKISKKSSKKSSSSKNSSHESKTVSASSISSSVDSDTSQSSSKNSIISNDNLLEPKPRVRAKKMLPMKQFVLNTASIHIESHTKSKIAARRKNRDRRLSLIAEQNA